VRAERKAMVVRINGIMDHVEEAKEKVVAAKKKKEKQAKPRSPSPSSSSDSDHSDKRAAP
jgi:hypothetical protein